MVMEMVSVFIEAVPANVLIAKAVCSDNSDSNGSYVNFGPQIRLRADKKLVLNRETIERAISRRLTENEWQSVTLNHTGAITKLGHSEIIFEDSEESEFIDAYWDKRLEQLKKDFND